MRGFWDGFPVGMIAGIGVMGVVCRFVLIPLASEVKKPVKPAIQYEELKPLTEEQFEEVKRIIRESTAVKE
jgi:hypothetical protein